jgi:acetyltransferase
VLVAKELEPGPEAFCGMTRDPDFGPVLAVGPGGTSVERTGRIAVSLAPLDAAHARELVAESGLDDPGGGLAEALVAVGRAAVEHPEIAEIDVNPLILTGGGAVAVDALVVVEPGASP